MRLKSSLFAIALTLGLCASASAQVRRTQPQQPAPATQPAQPAQQETKQPAREETKPPTLTPEEIFLFLELKGAEAQTQLNALVPPTDEDKAKAGMRLALL